MITVQVTTESGNSWTTGINCSVVEAMDYYLGKYFLTSGEKVELITSVEEIFEFDKSGNFKG